MHGMRGGKTVERAGEAGSVGTGCPGFYGLRESRCGFDVRLMGKAASLIDPIAWPSKFRDGVPLFGPG